MSETELHIGATLHNPKHSLRRFPWGGLFARVKTTSRPASRPFNRLNTLLMGSTSGGANIKLHGNVRTEHPLDLHGLLRRELQLGSIQMRTQLKTVFGQLGSIGQRKSLKPPRVSGDGTAKSTELVQSPEITHHLGTWPQPQMVGVHDDHACARFLDLVGRESFDGSLGSHWHEGRRWDLLVCSVERSCPSLSRAGLHDVMHSLRFQLAHGAS